MTCWAAWAALTLVLVADIALATPEPASVNFLAYGAVGAFIAMRRPLRGNSTVVAAALHPRTVGVWIRRPGPTIP